MNREDIYFMAKQVGIDSVEQYDSDTSPLELLEAFAKLVAAKEREACSSIASDYAQRLNSMTAVNIADAIRARGNT